ncbi:MAG: efflux RND transporter periplasmic adaptor subunit [Balneolales bacterium]
MYLLPTKLSISLITLCILASCGGYDNDSRRDYDEESTPTVEVLRAGYGSLPLEERLTGVVRARNQTEIYPEISGPIIHVYVNNGDKVNKDDPLVKIRDSEYKERLIQAESGYQIALARERQALTALNQLEVRLNRITTLADRQLESQSELEMIQAEVESARANLELVKAQKNQAASIIDERKASLANTVVRATTDGVVGLRNAEVGQQVSSGTRLFEIGDPDNIEISVVLTERMTNYIEIGQTVNLYSDAMRDTIIQASVTRISPFLNPVSHTTQAEIEVSNEGGKLRPGMYVSVDILYGETEQATLVPNNAIYNHPRHGVRGIYVAEALGNEYNLDDLADNEQASILGPTPVRFVPVDVIANGRLVSGVSGITSEAWIVTMGQNLLVGGNNEARFRMTEWNQILDLQQLHARDIFDIIENKYNKPIVNIDTAGG